MKKYLSSILSVGLGLLAFSYSSAQTGTWTKVVSNAPHANEGVMLLLTDGTVICHTTNGGSYGTGWDKLTPNASGSYINGTWSSIGSMGYNRLFFPTQVLPSGKVLAAGGEYGTGATRGEVYDPVANTWTATGTVVSSQNIYDGNSQILPSGVVLVGVQDGLDPSFNNLYYTLSTNAWTTAPSNVSPYNHDEAQWLKLPDSSILFVGIASTASVRYRPQTNTWVDDGTVPVNLYDRYGEEAGPGFMLPNGKAIFFGATGDNAIYTPTGTATAGTWATAATFPTIRGTQVGQADAPGAMMVNGHILLACSPIGTSANNEFNDPVYFVEYDYVSNTFTQVKSAIPGIGGDSVPNNSCYQTQMLDLPDGGVLFSIDQSNTYSSEYWEYTPGSAAIAAGKPTINSILPDGCPNYKLTGKLFNGISEGAAYGDDWQMSTNYPIIRLTNGTNVYYAKTTNWNRVGAVQTDSLEDTTVFTVPTLPAGTYSLYVVVNGFASNPTLFTVLGISSLTETNITCVTSVGSATVTASGGLSPLTYTWTPGGYTTASVSSLSAGVYTITVTDDNGCTATAAATITQAANFTVTASTTSNVTCNGGTNGSVSSIVSTGGTTPYTYSWSGGAGTNSTASGLSAGTYTLTVKDNCGSTETASTVITQPASSFSITIASYTNVSCFGGNGTITANAATGGSSPYTYSWSGGAGTNLTAMVSAGTYTITATESGGCGTATASVTITQPATSVGVNISSQTNSSCTGTGSATSAASGGTPPYTYSWTSGAGTNAAATNLSAGTYSVTTTDNNGCTASASVTITQTTDVINLSANTTANVSCNGLATGSASSNISGGTAPYTYSWSGGAGSNSSATGLSAGVYTLTVNDSCAGMATASVTITQPATISITADSINTSGGNCNGSAWALVSGGTVPYTYSWTGGLTTDTITNQCVADYCATVTDANGCTGSVCINISVSTGINQLGAKSEELTIYPNPSNGQFTIQSSVVSGRSSVEIYNVLGEKVYSTFSTFNSALSIDLSSEPSGVYFYRVIKENGGLLGEGKIVIER